MDYKKKITIFLDARDDTISDTSYYVTLQK